MKKPICLLIRVFGVGEGHGSTKFLEKVLSEPGFEVRVVGGRKYSGWLDEARDLPHRIGRIMAMVTKVKKRGKKVVIAGLSLGGFEASMVSMGATLPDGLIIFNGYFGQEIYHQELKKFRKSLNWLRFFDSRLRRLEAMVSGLNPEQIAVNTLIFVSKDDEVLSPENGEWLYNGLECTKKIVWLERAGHMLEKADAAKLVEVINQFRVNLIK